MNFETMLVERTPDGPRITQADPRVLISTDLVDEIERGWGADWVTLTDDDVITFRAINRTVIYRIDRDSYDPATRCYLMEWPD